MVSQSNGGRLGHNRHLEYWAPESDTHPREHNSKPPLIIIGAPSLQMGPGHVFAFHPSQIHVSQASSWSNSQHGTLQTLYPHPTSWNTGSDLGSQYLPYLWPVRC